MSGGGGGGKLWIYVLSIGALLTFGAYGLEHAHAGPSWLVPALLAIGGLMVVFGSCEAMILSVEGLGRRLKWNHFVAGTMAGLASNLPEVVMIGFVVAKEPRVAFVVVCLTIHVGAMAFGVYSGMLPHDAQGQARLPIPLVKLSTDLYACAAGVFFAMGTLMITLRAFGAGDGRGEGLLPGDLIALACGLLFVQGVNIVQLVKRFSGEDHSQPAAEPEKATQEPKPAEAPESEAAPASFGKIIAFGLLGIGTSVLGGHAVGEFAESLVGALTARGYSEMIGAMILSVFACAGVFVMIGMAHAKGMYEVAIANVSGAITQQPFLVLPVTMLLMAAFAHAGVIPTLEHGGVLAIDFETTSVVIFGFPAFLILWKSVQDDGKVNWLETASMIAVFAIVIFFLAEHGAPADLGAGAGGH